MKTHQRLLLAGASFVLAGCASKGEPAAKVTPPAAMQQVASNNARMQSKYNATFIFALNGLLAIRIHKRGKRHAVGANRRFDHVWHVALVVHLIEVLKLLA